MNLANSGRIEELSNLVAVTVPGGAGKTAPTVIKPTPLPKPLPTSLGGGGPIYKTAPPAVVVVNTPPIYENRMPGNSGGNFGSGGGGGGGSEEKSMQQGATDTKVEFFKTTTGKVTLAFTGLLILVGGFIAYKKYSKA